MTNIFESIIYLFIAPWGLIPLAILIWLEYRIGKSIMADPHRITVKMIKEYYQKYFVTPFERPTETKITKTEQIILQVVTQHGNIGVKEIARTIGRKPDTTRKLINDLLRHGYVSREVDPYDHRAFFYLATEQYRK